MFRATTPTDFPLKTQWSKPLKAAAIQYVKENENIIVNDDVADAICLGYAYLQEHEEENLNWE